MLRFAGKFVSSFHVEDVVHDVFLRLWDKQIFLLTDDQIRRVLYAAVRNGCIDHLRREVLGQKLSESGDTFLKLAELDFHGDAEHVFMRHDTVEQVLNKADELPPKRREIFFMAYVEGWKAVEIAERLNLSERTVENNLYRALLFLRDAFVVKKQGKE